jgi:hypothetical protein
MLVVEAAGHMRPHQVVQVVQVAVVTEVFQDLQVHQILVVEAADQLLAVILLQVVVMEVMAVKVS